MYSNAPISCVTQRKNAVKPNSLSIIKHYLQLSFFPHLIQCQTFSCQPFCTWQLSDLVLRLLCCGHIWVCNTKEFQSETQPGFNESRKHCSFFVFHYDKQTIKNIFGLDRAFFGLQMGEPDKLLVSDYVVVGQWGTECLATLRNSLLHYNFSCCHQLKWSIVLIRDSVAWLLSVFWGCWEWLSWL